jgi:hypothetical protein
MNLKSGYLLECEIDGARGCLVERELVSQMEALKCAI